MLEYNEHQLLRTVPPSELAYTKALTQAYNQALISLEKTKGIYTQKRLNDIISKISKELYAINKDFAKAYPKDANVILQASNTYTEDEMALALQHAGIQATLYEVPKSMIKEFTTMDKIEYFRVDAKGVRHATATSSDAMIKSIASSNSSKVKSIILAEGSIGTSPSVIASRIRPYISGDSSRRDIRTVVSSLLGESNARASDKFYKENDEYIDYYLYDATLDSRTSTLCRSLSGKKFQKDELTAYNTPKNHPNCRSVLVAIPEGYEFGTRPVVLPDGTIHIVKADMSFAEAQKLYPSLNNKKLINMDTYLKSVDVKKRNVKVKSISKPSIDLPTDKKLTPKQMDSIKTLSDLEMITQYNNTEHAGLFDTNGNKKFIKKGRKAEVSFNGNEVELMKNGILTHNHPNGFGFSADDLNVAIVADLQEIRAVGKDYVYRFIRPEKGWDSKVSVPKSFLKNARAKGKYIDYTEEGINAWLEDVTKSYDLEYIRELI